MLQKSLLLWNTGRHQFFVPTIYTGHGRGIFCRDVRPPDIGWTPELTFSWREHWLLGGLFNALFQQFFGTHLHEFIPKVILSPGIDHLSRLFPGNQTFFRQRFNVLCSLKVRVLKTALGFPNFLFRPQVN